MSSTSQLQLPPPRNTAVPSAVASSSQQQQQQQQRPHQPQRATSYANATAVAVPTRKAPSYEERCRAAAEASKLRQQQPSPERPKSQLFVPRQLADFDDGGAFPEIHVAQYPRHMGNPHLPRKPTAGVAEGGRTVVATTTGAVTSRAIVNVEIDEKGEISYDAIVKGGTNSDKLVYTKLEDMRGGEAAPSDVALPTPEEEASEAARTQAALQALLLKKTAGSSVVLKASQSSSSQPKTEFIKYTARPDAPGYNPVASTRIVQMVAAQLDPLMPPKHKHVKAPRGPAEDPVPVLHAPPTKLTKEEQEAWKVPACISNWKNTRGYTIPLDKRLAADGRGLLSAEVNSTNFAALSESLYVAERQARQEVRLRAVTQQKLALQETQERESALRQLAQQARLERGGGAVYSTNETIDAVPTRHEEEEENANDEDDDSLEPSKDAGQVHRVPQQHRETEDEVAARQREKLRMERKRERERELRIEQSVALKKKQRLEEERDVSEKIALGVQNSTGTGGGLDNVDSRLYNQTAGMDSGFGADDEYSAYSKPLFDREPASSSIYRPTRGETEYNADEQYDKLKQGATSKFQPHKGFGGAEGGVSGAGSRTAPVQFEKAKPK